jgi:carbon storage regulator
MLVLTRKLGEQILIGADIRVVVVGVRGERVRLGVIAPDSVRVDRREVHQRRTKASTASSRVPD